MNTFSLAIFALVATLTTSLIAQDPASNRSFLWKPYEPNGATGSMTAIDHFAGLIGINDAGQIIGYATWDSRRLGGPILAIWDPVQGPVRVSAPTDFLPRAITRAGQVMGYYGQNSTWALRDTVSELRDLGTLVSATSLRAVNLYGANDAGQVVGMGFEESGYSRAFIWDATRGARVLDSLPGPFVMSIALAVNNAGQVVGTSNTRLGASKAFIWDEVGGMREIGQRLSPRSINDAGQVVGMGAVESEGAFTARAFIWDATRGLRYLDGLPGMWASTAYAINNAGQVVGQAVMDDNSQKAFIWDEVGGMRDIGTLGGLQAVALDINNTGEVMGYLFSPPPPAAIPEPSLWTAITTLGLLGVAIHRRVKRDWRES